MEGEEEEDKGKEGDVNNGGGGENNDDPSTPHEKERREEVMTDWNNSPVQCVRCSSSSSTRESESNRGTTMRCNDRGDESMKNNVWKSCRR